MSIRYRSNTRIISTIHNKYANNNQNRHNRQHTKIASYNKKSRKKKKKRNENRNEKKKEKKQTINNNNKQKTTKERYDRNTQQQYIIANRIIQHIRKRNSTQRA